MVRLAGSGLNEGVWREIARRVRGATIATCCDAAQPGGPAEPCEAVAFLGSVLPATDLVEPFLGAGKHVLLATELSVGNDELDTLVAAAKQAGAQLAVANPDRYLPSRQLIRQQLDAGQGKLGETGLVRVHRWEPAGPAQAEPQTGDLPGPLVRDLDLATWLVGSQPERVYALEHRADVRDAWTGRYLQVHLGFAGGGMALLDYSARLPEGDGYAALSVIGSSGAAYADDHQNMQLVYRGGRPLAVRTEESVQQLAGVVQEFVDALAAGRDMSASVRAWQDVLALAAAVRRSCKTRHVVLLQASHDE
jgi:predicted dehydrogenase